MGIANDVCPDGPKIEIESPREVRPSHVAESAVSNATAPHRAALLHLFF